jgi:hypothetical protein
MSEAEEQMFQEQESSKLKTLENYWEEMIKNYNPESPELF